MQHFLLVFSHVIEIIHIFGKYIVYGFLGEKMTTNSNKVDQHVHGDQQGRFRLVSPSTGIRYDLNEKGDYDLSTKSNMHDTTKNLIINESRHNTSGYETSSCTLSTNTEDTCDDDVSMRSTKSSEREVVIEKGESCCYCYIPHVNDLHR